MTLQPLVRDRDRAVIGGVSGAVARSAGLDPVLVRIGFVLLAFLTGGVGVLGYLALWGLTPSRTDGVVPLRRWLPFTRTWSPFALIAGVLGTCLVVGTLLTGSGPGTLIVVLVVVALVRGSGSRRPTEPPTPRPEPRTPFERLSVDWDQRLTNIDAGRPADWDPESAALPVGAYAPSDVVGSSVHRRLGRRSWFGVLVGVGAVWFVCSTLAMAGIEVSALAWTSGTLAVLALALLWSARPARAARGRPPLLATVTVLTALMTAGLLIGTVASQTWGAKAQVATGPAPTITSGLADLGIGEHTLDFSDTIVTADSEVTYDMLAGDIELRVPRTGNVVVTTAVDAGTISGISGERDGMQLQETWSRIEEPDQPTLTINLRLRAGEITVVQP